MATATPAAAVLDLRRPFTRAEALAAGVTPAQLRGPTYQHVFFDVYVHELIRAHPLVRVWAALLTHPPTAFASHSSAARVYRLPIPSLPTEHVSVFRAVDRRRRQGVTSHVAPPDTAVREIDGLRVSSPTRLFVELASLLPLVDLVVVGDVMVRRGLVTLPELVAACARARGEGAAAARTAAGFVREEVDSVMETRLRMLIVLAGLPEPTVNHRLYDENGRLRYRLDLSYPELKLIVEYDGRQHVEDPGQADHDLSRREWFDLHGWMIVPVVARGIYRRPDQTLDRVLAALKSRGCPGLPSSLSDAWRPHFRVIR